ncbi:hypothetical protein K438DRAFT_1600935, partial [Mycena galopus ATCC 62051]
WHHILKGKFFQGKRNRRLNHHIHTLIKHICLYYPLKEHLQAMGFEGPDLEVQKRIDIKK